MLTVTIDTGNAAFHSEEEDANAAGHECSRLLGIVAERLEDGETAGRLVDYNGNTVGSFELTEG